MSKVARLMVKAVEKRTRVRLLPVLLLGVLLAGALSVVYAQAQGDPLLQGRLLQSSDGTLFLYWNGAKFGVDILQLSDDVLDGIPDGGTVSRISDLVGQLGAHASRTSASRSSATRSAGVKPSSSSVPG
jgi:hypothetical protein